MRKIIILTISLILLGLGVFFVVKLNSELNNNYIKEYGNLTFEYEKITSTNKPTEDKKFVTSITDLKTIVDGHNFNTKHSYIYIRIPSDNKHKLKITNVALTVTGVVCLVEKSAALENIQIEKVDTIEEYIIDIHGLIDTEQSITVNINDLTAVPEIDSSTQENTEQQPAT